MRMVVVEPKFLSRSRSFTRFGGSYLVILDYIVPDSALVCTRGRAKMVQLLQSHIDEDWGGYEEGQGQGGGEEKRKKTADPTNAHTQAPRYNL